MTYVSPLISDECARRFQKLAMGLAPLQGVSGMFQLVKQGTTEPLTNDGQAQSARCVFCRKVLKSWGARPKGKKQAYWNKYDQLKGLQASHSNACAEEWAWKTLAKWWHEPGSREILIVTEWLRKLTDEVADLTRRGHAGEITVRSAVAITHMFGRLPSRDMTIVQAIELGLQTAKFELDQWPDYKPFTHGTQEHPHVFLPYKFADAEFGVWGMCPCGTIEWRGEDMPLTDRLIGWDRAGSGMRSAVMRSAPHEKLHIGATSRIEWAPSGKCTRLGPPCNREKDCRHAEICVRTVEALSGQSTRKDSP